MRLTRTFALPDNTNKGEVSTEPLRGCLVARLIKTDGVLKEKRELGFIKSG
jgi:hypothetical protein